MAVPAAEPDPAQPDPAGAVESVGVTGPVGPAGPVTGGGDAGRGAPTGLPARVRGRARRPVPVDRADASPVDRSLPVTGELRALLPRGGLRRGSTVLVAADEHGAAGGRSLVLALLAEVSAAGGWAAVVGMPELGALAAAQAGVALERLAFVPEPGPEWPAVVAALLDGIDMVVVQPPGRVTTQVSGRLAARARSRGSVLVPYRWWPGADLTLTTGPGVWHGLGAGRGRLRHRELTVTAQGRGAATRPRRRRVQLPDPHGRLAAVPGTGADVTGGHDPHGRRPGRHDDGAGDRPTCVPGEAA